MRFSRNYGWIKADAAMAAGREPLSTIDWRLDMGFSDNEKFPDLNAIHRILTGASTGYIVIKSTTRTRLRRASVDVCSSWYS